MPQGDEPDASGGGSFSASGNVGRGRRSQPINIQGSFGIAIPELQALQSSIAGVSQAMSDLRTTMQNMSTAFTSGPIVNMLSQIARSAQVTTQSLNALSSSVRGLNGIRPTGAGGGGGGGGAMAAAASGAGAPPPSYSAMSGVRSTGSGGAMGTSFSDLGTRTGDALKKISDAGVGALSNMIPIIGPMVGPLLQYAGDMAMFPLRFTRERIQNNRVSTLAMAEELTPYQWMTGQKTIDMMYSLKNIPGGMKGGVSDILQALTIGRRSGATYGFDIGNANSNYGLPQSAPNRDRGANFYGMVGQFQKITPGLNAAQVAATVGGQLSNVASQQSAAFYTSGAFSLVGVGGGMKTASEWAEGILNWLKAQRPGRDRGKDFTYGELLAQNFPGSNINAWFQTVGVSDQMREYWWAWALAKTKMNVSGDEVFENMRNKLQSNVAIRRSDAVTAITRNEFGLSGQMANQYAQREKVNKWYNQAVGAAVNRIIPRITAAGPMAMIQNVPDEVENYLWNMLESSGPLLQLVGSTMFNASAIISAAGSPISSAVSEILPDQLDRFNPFPSNENMPVLPGFNPYDDYSAPGDIGDIGNYGSTGGTSTAGLHPDLRKKVNALLKANPRLKINSGLRDGYTQAKLQNKGIGNFGSGSPYIGKGRTLNRQSPHSNGMAVDIGPRSQYDWLMKNAQKFGLQTGAGYGEPWHIQTMGTIGPGRHKNPAGKGDIGDIGDFPNPLDTLNPLDEIIDGLKIIVNLFKLLFNGISTIAGMASPGGLFDITGGTAEKKTSQYMSLMGLGMASGLPSDRIVSEYDDSPLSTSFDFSNDWTGSATFGATAPAGDIGSPSYSMAKTDMYVGDYYSGYPSGSKSSSQTLQFNNTFHLNTGGMSNGIDVSRIVPIIADRLEEEMNKRMVRIR